MSLTDTQIAEMRDKGLLHGEKMNCKHCKKLVEYFNDVLEDLTAALY